MTEVEKSETPVNAQEIKLRTVRGASSMFVRQLIMLAVNFAASVILARMLSPEDFGIYVVSAFVVNTLMFLTDIGLGAALIQRREEPALAHYRTIFTFQLSVVLFLVVLIYIVSPWVVRVYNIEDRVTWYVRFMSLTLLLASIGSVSTIKLERQLAYHVFARIDVITVLADKGIAVAMAMLGYGYWSFLVAGLFSSLIRITALYRAAPWSIGLSWDKPFFLSTVHFGGMFQLAGLTALFRDNLNSLFVGPLFGPRAVGYLNWAHNTSMQGSQIFTQIVNRINFPTLSRAQDDPAVLTAIVNKSLKLLNVLTVPILTIMMALIHEIVAVIYTSQWNDAIPAFYCYALLMMGGNITTTLSGFLLATGKAKTNLVIMVAWTIIVWVSAFFLVKLFGYIGIVLAAVLSVIIISVWLIVTTNRTISIDIVSSIVKPFGASFAVGALAYGVRGLFPTNLAALLLLSATSLLLSWSFNLLIDKELKRDLRLIFDTIRA